MNRNLFRKNAMLKAASPFELNRLVSIFNGREALALLLSLVGADRVTVRVPLIPGFNSEEDRRVSCLALRRMGARLLDCFTYRPSAPPTDPQ